MFLDQYRCAIGKFSSRQDVEKVLAELNQVGFSLAQLSVISHDAQSTRGTAGIGMKEPMNHDILSEATIGESVGMLLGGIGGFYVGLGILGISGVGLATITLGSTATLLAMILGGAAIGNLIGSSIDALSASDSYDASGFESHRSNHGEYLVMISGTEAEITLAESILSRSCPTKVWVC